MRPALADVEAPARLAGDAAWTRGTSVREGAAWMSAGNGAYLLAQYGMLIATARLGTPALVGQLALAHAIAAPVMTFAQMNLRQVQVTDLRGEAGFGDYLSTRALTTLLGLTIVLGIAATLIDGQGTALVVVWVGAMKAMESMSDIVHGHLQRYDRLDLVAGSLVAKAAATLTIFALLFWLSGRLDAALTGVAVIMAGFFLLVDLPFGRRTSPETDLFLWQAPAMRCLVAVAVPLALASGLGSFSSNVPRYFLDHFQGKEAVAIYSLAMGPVALIGVLTSSISQATLRRTSDLLQSGRTAPFRALVVRLTLAQTLPGIASAIVFWAAGPAVVRVLFGPEYEPAAPVFALMSLAVALGGLAVFGSSVLAGARQFRQQLVNIVLAVLTQVPLCALLIPRHGPIAAAWVELARYGVCTLYLNIAGLAAFRHCRAPDSRGTA